MEHMKRSASDSIFQYDDSKRQKTSVTTADTYGLTEESVTSLEDLSNELIYEIFEFLDYHHAFYTFYNLNERFQNLFVHSNIPIKINISSISKYAFQHYLTDLIIPHAHKIKSFQLSNPFSGNMMLLMAPTIKDLTKLTTLIINNIEADCIDEVVHHLSSLPVLSSLTITCTDYIKNLNDIYGRIFRLPTLKYCQLTLETNRYLLPLSFAKNQFSPIEHLVINSKVSFNQVDSLLSYVPQVRRLSFGHLDGSRNHRTHNNSIILTYLEDVSLELYFVSFNDFELLVTDCFRQVTTFRVLICRRSFYYYNNVEYLNADRWERLISTHMINLRTFDFHHRHRILRFEDNRTTYEEQAKKFNSSFWMKRQWFFECQYEQAMRIRFATFYSTNPYRRKHYMLCEKKENSINSCPVNNAMHPIRHVDIYSNDAMQRCSDNFPNATQLTLSETFDVPRDSLATNLNRIIPLKQLTHLNLNCHRFHFQQIIELLHSTPNIRTLLLDSVLLYGLNSISFEQDDIFQIVSNTNVITNLTIGNECTLDKIQLIMTLFPRLEYLTINLHKEDLESITRFLLSKFNDNTRHLSSLCISKQRRILVEQMKVLLESEKLLDDYILKVTNRKLYLWW